jgi:hypothetical protein
MVSFLFFKTTLSRVVYKTAQYGAVLEKRLKMEPF